MRPQTSSLKRIRGQHHLGRLAKRSRIEYSVHQNGTLSSDESSHSAACIQAGSSTVCTNAG